MKPSRVVIVFGALASLIALIFVCSALLLPRIVDSERMKEKISSELAKKSSGRFAFGKIAVLWFPRPAVVIEAAQFSFGEKARGSIRTAKIYPSIYYLLTGRLVVRRALMQEPKLSIRLPERSERPFDVEELEKQIRSALDRFATGLPAPRLELSDGSADIKIGDKPPVLLDNVSAQTVGSPGALRFELSARSNLCAQLRVEGKISPENLASQLDVGVQRLKIKESLALLPLPIPAYAQQGEASFDVKMASVGLRKIKASIGGSVGPVVLARHGSKATLEVKRLKGGMTYEGGVFQVAAEQLDFGAPRVKASGEFKVQPGLISARLNVRDVDIAEVGTLALRMAGDTEAVKKALHYVPGGIIREMSIQSGGRSVAEMLLRKNIALSGVMRNGKIVLPGSELELQNVSGSVRISQGTLEATNVSANHGTMRGWNGVLRLGLEGKTAPFHLDLSVRSGAAELQAVLLKLVRNETFRKELLKVRNPEGELSGRLILGERLNAISPIVTLSKADISATYTPIPFPITIRGGRLNYDQNIIRVENVEGSVGRSSFGELGVTFHRDGSRQLNVESRRVFLDLQQTDTLLRGYKDLPPQFEKWQSARGQIELDNLKLTGAYDDPAGWAFASAGRFDHVEITHDDLPGRVTVSRGKFDAKQGQIKFSDAAAVMSDASLIASGTFEYQKGGASQFDIGGTATIGAQMTEWLSRRVDLPEALQLRSPVKIAAGHLAWHAGGDISFRGRVTVAGGPQLSLDAVKQPQRLAVQNLTIDDGGRRARMTLQLAKDNLDLSFNGELMQRTIDKIFASFPMKGSALRGNIRVNATVAKPFRVSASGQLSGSNLLIPLGTEKALVERFSIEANGPSVEVRSAELRWSKSRLAVSGNVTSAKDILQLDADVTGDQLDWEELQRFFSRDGKQRQEANGGVVSIPPVEGVIRLKTGRFSFERFNLSPLQMTAAISPSGIRAKIDHGIACGITIKGSVDVVGKEIGLDAQLTATEAQLEPTSICLTNQQNDVKGTYSLTARISGRGDRDGLRSALKGNFELSARDGEFVRSAGIDATFDYLNATGDFKVEFPDLDRKAFPYRLVAVKGSIDGEILTANEVVVQSSQLDLSGQGKVDLARKQIDGKALVAVLRPVDEVIRQIPLVGSIFGGSLVAIPVRVTGSLKRPDVTYLSPEDVGMELLNVPMRILGLPMGAIRLFTPGGDAGDKTIAK
ncbi:MAG: AsmA-like C-terminal domain-containing protein [Alphaproteobacteria bacterium]